MNDLEVRRYQMFTRVRDFGAAHAESFQSPSLAIELFAAVSAVVTELTGHAAVQLSGSRAARQSTATKAVIREELHEDLAAISRTARSIAQPGLEDKFRLPRNGNDQLLLNAARAIASDAAPFVDELVRRELPANFLEELNAKIELFEKAISDKNQGTVAQVSATAAIDQAIERGMNGVRQLDAIVRNRFSNDPVTLAAWVSASHTERAPRSADTAKTAEPATTDK